ncbi:uncharacterized protein LOC120185233 [Hibiscus syriacus]|uniref:uncharacterized protein LOC120185233 n=1 Tax=Hibiscus syriacus TaxID=106335 RepID=UPI001922C845|nr:uncharacterized protein LOC120185233 [Hibiscus syriacus]
MFLMGDLRDCSPEPNFVSSRDRSSPSPSNQKEISAGYWRKAEEATQGIIAMSSQLLFQKREEKRLLYVQRLIRSYLGCEVFPFGSVPLKTYLPDGDIDLTAFGGLNLEEAMVNDVCSVLEREDHNTAAEFVVKDVQLIRAEVKLVKCLVQNIVVDISFNQLGGLSTLCFLEQVDRLIGKDHLFKRSIILIKAWCYYESRILGAHHGLISTYGLETLVLYIFHLFHSSLDGPLAVLYKFLDYFSKFDWEKYCVSLNGPIHLSSLPDIVVETPENGGGDLLLSNDFLRECVEMFSVPSRGFETNSRTFPQKHLNIVDPLRENNNLGRSVSKGNFYRIRSAFTYGARNLGQILSQPEERIGDELLKFFSNTLDWHGNGLWPNVQDPAPLSMYRGFGATSPASGTESCQEDQTLYESDSSNSSTVTGNYRSDLEGSLHKVNNGDVFGREANFSRTFCEPEGSANSVCVSEIRHTGDATDLAISKIQGLVISNNAHKSPPSAEDSFSSSGHVSVRHAPHLYFCNSSLDNGEMRNGNLEYKHPENSGSTEKNASCAILPAGSEEMGANVHSDHSVNQLSSSLGVQSPFGRKNHPLISNLAWSSEDLYPGHSGYPAFRSSVGSQEVLSSLSDLSGDYDANIRSLSSGQWCYDCSLSASVPSISSPLISKLQRKNSWDVVRKSVQFRRNAISPMNANSVVPQQAYPMNPPVLPGSSFGMEEMPKPRGTGTYFPNPSTTYYNDRPSTPRGRNPALARSPRNNGQAITPPRAKFTTEEL